MRPAFALVLVLAACQQKSASSETATTSGSGNTTAPKTLPEGPYIIKYDCSHSNQPFGEGGSVSNRSFDLKAGTLTVLAYEYHDPSKLPPGTKEPEHTPQVVPLSTQVIAKLDHAAKRVLAGGPYKPEYPVSEGTPCHLSIDANGKQLFAIDKAYTNQADAVTDLVKAFGSSN